MYYKRFPFIHSFHVRTLLRSHLTQTSDAVPFEAQGGMSSGTCVLVGNYIIHIQSLKERDLILDLTGIKRHRSK
jgi:hypothetical protein